MFDDKFVWGVASSAYQVEGTDPDDGRGKTVWDTFTEQGRIFQNQNAYTSCDHMHHYKDDSKQPMQRPWSTPTMPSAPI